MNVDDTLLKKCGRSLAGKLIITLGLLIMIGGGLSWYMLIRNSRNVLMENAVEYTSSYSDLVKKSTRHSMLTFHRDAIQKTIEYIGAERDIERIRIFDSKGKIFYSSREGERGGMVDRSSIACVGCHADVERPAETLKSDGKWVIQDGKGGQRILTYVDPIYNDPDCYSASCHAHARTQKVLGILETDFSLASLDASIHDQTVDITIYAVAFMGLSAVVLFFVLRRFVLNPVSTLSKAMTKVAEGDIRQTVRAETQDEMGLLADVFNMMTKDLEIAKERMEDWTGTLEAEISKKIEELKKSQGKLVQAEKLASLGRLTADVAHEIRNPLTAIGGFAHRLHKIATSPKEKEYAELVIKEVERLEKILRDVLTFSRHARFHLERHALGDIIRETARMFVDICEEQNIRMEISVRDDLPQVLIDRDQVRQALGNLLMNSVDAMPDGGLLTVETGKEELHEVPYVFVRVSDSGQGIPEDKLPLMFEPFFSTKEIHGTGLGLSITRKIMEEHCGFVRAESTVGKGTTFSLYFPFQSEEEASGVNCWEYMKCGRDKDAAEKCPAYPHFGRACWAVAGTFCEGKVQGTFAQKYEDCKKCEFYRKVTSRETAR